MFAAFRAFFAVFLAMFTVVEKNVNTVLILSGIGEDMANQYADTAKMDREINEIKNRARQVKALAKAKAEALALESST